MASTKQYWMIDPENNEISQTPHFAEFRGGIFHIPRNATTIEPIEVKDGYAVVATFNDDGGVSGSELVEDHRGQTIYSIDNCEVEKTVNSLGAIDDEWTLLVPTTVFDEWNGDNWVTNVSDQYIETYNQVDDARRAAYVETVSPLTEEAYIKRYLIKTDAAIAEAEELEKQALAAREKIQTENPWPEPVES